MTFENMWKREKMMKDVIQPGVYGHAICSLIQFALWNEAPISQYTDEHTATSSHHDLSRSRSEGFETVEKQWLIERERGIRTAKYMCCR